MRIKYRTCNPGHRKKKIKTYDVETCVQDKNENEMWSLEPSVQDKTKPSVLDKTRLKYVCWTATFWIKVTKINGLEPAVLNKAERICGLHPCAVNET